MQIRNAANAAHRAYIQNRMFEYNAMHFADAYKGRYEELNLFLTDEEGQVCGGIVGDFCWGWLEIQYVYVDVRYRKQGYGRQLLREVEKLAREKRCDFIKLDTLSFQALDFYVKEGYEVYGVIENAGGHTHYYLKKTL